MKCEFFRENENPKIGKICGEKSWFLGQDPRLQSHPPRATPTPHPHPTCTGSEPLQVEGKRQPNRKG